MTLFTKFFEEDTVGKRSLIEPGTVVRCLDADITNCFCPATRDEIALMKPGSTFWLLAKAYSVGGVRAFVKCRVTQLHCERIYYHDGRERGHIFNEKGVRIVDDETLLLAATAAHPGAAKVIERPDDLSDKAATLVRALT